MIRPISIVLLCVLVIAQAKAQKNISSFLSDMAVNDFKINSSIKDLEKNKNLKDNLIFIDKNDDESSYSYRKTDLNFTSSINLSDATFIFKTDKLNKVIFEKIGDLSDGIFKQVYNELVSKYGKPMIFPVKNMLYSRYEWHYKDFELILKPLKISFLVIYGKKPVVRHQWIYSDRKGNGNYNMQLNLGYWEEVVNSNFTINSFEKCLPEWATTGEGNHILYDFNSETKKRDIPQYVIRYQLNSCDIRITTKDTISKIIDEYEIFNIKDQNLYKKFITTIVKSGYKIDNDVEDPWSTFYINKDKKIMIMVTKKDIGYSFNFSKE